MAKPFVLTAQINLQAPNARKVIQNITQQLNNINAKVNVNIPKSTSQQLNKVNKSIQNVGNSAAKAGKDMGKFTGGIRGALTYLVKYDLARTIINGVVDTIRDGTQAAISFEKEMIKVGQVTGKSLTQLSGLQNEISRLSKTLGVSSSSLVKTSRILAQTGISAKEVKISLDALAKTTLAATFDDITSTTETAIAAMRQFGFGAKQLETELGRINALAGNFAVEAGDIGVAIKRAGGAFKAAGGQLVELEALFTSVRSTTRETAETIATGFRTIFTRIQRPKTIQFLRQVGVELQDLAGNFVGPFEAVRRLNIALKDLDPRDVRYSQIVEQLGGFRQVSKVIPLIQQFAVAQKALSVAQQGGNSLARDAEKAQKGLGNQIAKVKEEFQELFRTLVGGTGFQSMIKLALDLARAMVKVAEAVAPLVPLLATLAVGKGLGFLATGMGRGKGKHEGGRIHKFAAGGSVPGTGNRDTVPAMLTPGEFVIKKSSVKSIGSGNLQKMNKYAGGGTVVSASKEELERSYPDLKKRTSLAKGKSYSIRLKKHEYDKRSGDGKKLMANLIKAKRRKKDPLTWPYWEKVVATHIKRRPSKGNRPLDYPKDPGEAKYMSWGATYSKDGQKTEKGNTGTTYIAKSLLDPATQTATLATASGLNKNGRKSGGKKSPTVNAYYPDNARSWAGALSSFLPGGKQANADMWGDIELGPKNKKKKKPMAGGGGISGTDTVSAMLTPGEFVVNRQSASRIGYGNLEKANRTGSSPQGFAAGGRVPSSGKSHFGSSPASSNSNDDGGGGGGGGAALKAIFALDLILPILAGKFKAVDGEVSELGAAVDAASNTMLTLTTIALLFGESLKKAATAGGIGGAGQAFIAAVGAASFALGQYQAELGKQQKKAALFSVTEGEGFKSESETAAARAKFKQGARDEEAGKGAATGGAAGTGVGAAVGLFFGGPIGAQIGASIGSAAGSFIGSELGGVFGSTVEQMEKFDGKIRTLRLGESLAKLQSSLKRFSAGQSSAQSAAGAVTRNLQELVSSSGRIGSGEELVAFQGAVSKAIPGISEFINKVASSSDSFLELQNIVGKKTLNAFSQLSGVSLEDMKRSIEEAVVVRRKATAAQNAQLLAIQATNKVLRQARNAISAFSSIEQSLTRFDSALDNVGQSISNNFGPASISKMAPQFSDISNIIDFDSFNQQVDNLGTIMGSAGSGLTNDIKQFAQVSNILPNVLTEAAGEIGIGGARASDIIEKKLIAADPGGIIGDEFRQAIVKRITAMSDMADGGEGKFAGRIREDIEGVVNDLTKGMTESQNAFQKAAEFIDAANARLGKAYSLRTKLELNIAKQLSNIIGLQYENSQRIRKAKGQDPDAVGGAIAFAAQQNALLGGTQISGMGTNVRIVSQEFLRLKKKISESNAELSKFGIDATSGVSDLTDSQRALIDENAKLKEEFSKTQSVLKNYSDIQQRVGALQEKIAKEQSKRGQVLSAASSLAFATDQRRAEMGREMYAAQVAARKGIDAIPSSMRAGVLSMLNMFSEVAVFDGKTGSEVKKEIDISYLEKLLGPLTDAQKKLITESTTAEERFINEMKRVQGQAEQAQKALLIGMGDDRKELASTIGNLHRELVSGIKSIFLQQQQRGVEKQISETRSTGNVAQKQLDILKNIQNGGIPVENPSVLQAVRSNIETVKSLKEARKKEADFNKVAASTGVIGNNTFQDVKGNAEQQNAARRNNARSLDNLGGKLRSTLGVDLGNQVTQILRDAMRSENLKATEAGIGQTSGGIAEALRQAMSEFGSMQAGEQRDIIGTNMSTLNDAGLGPYINELQNNIEYLGSSLGQLPEGATWASLTGEVDATTTGLVSLNAQLSQIQQNSMTNQATGNAAASQGGGGGGPVAYAAGGFAPRGTDTVPAMLTPGEFVVNRSAAQRNSGALKAINSGKSQYLAGGGEVQKWFGSTGAVDNRFVHKKPEENAIKAMIKYVAGNFSANKIDDSGQGKYNIKAHGNQDLPGLVNSAWGAEVGIGVPSVKFAGADIKRWKPDGRLVKTIPEANAYINSAELPSNGTLYASDITREANKYKYSVDKFHRPVNSEDGIGTVPLFNTGNLDHAQLKGRKDSSTSDGTNDYSLSGTGGEFGMSQADIDNAKRIWGVFTQFGADATKQSARGGMPYNINDLTESWKIKTGNTEVSGHKWDDDGARKWFDGPGGRTTIQQESLDGYGSYVDQVKVKDDYAVALGTSLRKVGTSWEDQLKGVSSTYGHKASTALKANIPEIQKFLKDGNSGNYQKDFLDSIFNQLNPNGPWSVYSEEERAYSRGNNPWWNLGNLSTRFMANYTGKGSPTSRGQFSDFLDIDPTNSRHWDPEKTIGNAIPFYEGIAKERGIARAELVKFFNDRQGMASGDVRYAAAQGMDDFQELIGSKVPNIGMKYVLGQKEEQDNKEDQKAAMDESLINDVKTSRAAIKSPLLKTSDFVEKLNVNSKRMRAVNDFTKVPSYAKRAGLTGTRDLQDVKWNNAAIDAVFPFLAKLSNDLKVLVSAGLVKRIDKDGVEFDGGRLYETLSKSFDLIMEGKPDTNFLDVVKPNGQIASNAFIGSSEGGGLFDRMKMWSRGSSTWYGGLKGGELESMNALFGKGKVSDSVNKMQKQSYSALDSIIKKYDTVNVEPQLLAAGGTAFSPQGTDTVPAMLTPGEFVVNKKSAQANMPLLKSINSGTQYLAGGGSVQQSDLIDGFLTTSEQSSGEVQDQYGFKKDHWPPTIVYEQGYKRPIEKRSNNNGFVITSNIPPDNEKGGGKKWSEDNPFGYKIVNEKSIEKPGESTKSNGWAKHNGNRFSELDLLNSIGYKGDKSRQLKSATSSDVERFTSFKESNTSPGSLVKYLEESSKVGSKKSFTNKDLNTAPMFDNEGEPKWTGVGTYSPNIAREILSYVDPVKYLGAFKRNSFMEKAKGAFKTQFSGYEDTSNNAFEDGRPGSLKTLRNLNIQAYDYKMSKEVEAAQKESTNELLKLFISHRQEQGMPVVGSPQVRNEAGDLIFDEDRRSPLGKAFSATTIQGGFQSDQNMSSDTIMSKEIFKRLIRHPGWTPSGDESSNIQSLYKKADIQRTIKKQNALMGARDGMLDGSDMGLQLWADANTSYTQGGTGLNDQAVSSLADMQSLIVGYKVPQGPESYSVYKDDEISPNYDPRDIDKDGSIAPYESLPVDLKSPMVRSIIDYSAGSHWRMSSSDQIDTDLAKAEQDSLGISSKANENIELAKQLRISKVWAKYLERVLIADPSIANTMSQSKGGMAQKESKGSMSPEEYKAWRDKGFAGENVGGGLGVAQAIWETGAAVLSPIGSAIGSGVNSVSETTNDAVAMYGFASEVKRMREAGFSKDEINRRGAGLFEASKRGVSQSVEDSTVGNVLEGAATGISNLTQAALAVPGAVFDAGSMATGNENNGGLAGLGTSVMGLGDSAMSLFTGVEYEDKTVERLMASGMSQQDAEDRQNAMIVGEVIGGLALGGMGAVKTAKTGSIMSSAKNFATGAGHKSGFLTSSKTTQGIGNFFNNMTNKDTYFTGKGPRLSGPKPTDVAASMKNAVGNNPTGMDKFMPFDEWGLKPLQPNGPIAPTGGFPQSGPLWNRANRKVPNGQPTYAPKSPGLQQYVGGVADNVGINPSYKYAYLDDLISPKGPSEIVGGGAPNTIPQAKPIPNRTGIQNPNYSAQAPVPSQSSIARTREAAEALRVANQAKINALYGTTDVMAPAGPGSTATVGRYGRPNIQGVSNNSIQVQTGQGINIRPTSQSQMFQGGFLDANSSIQTGNIALGGTPKFWTPRPRLTTPVAGGKLPPPPTPVPTGKPAVGGKPPIPPRSVLTSQTTTPVVGGKPPTPPRSILPQDPNTPVPGTVTTPRSRPQFDENGRAINVGATPNQQASIVQVNRDPLGAATPQQSMIEQIAELGSRPELNTQRPGRWDRFKDWFKNKAGIDSDNVNIRSNNLAKHNKEIAAREAFDLQKKSLQAIRLKKAGVTDDNLRKFANDKLSFEEAMSTKPIKKPAHVDPKPTVSARIQAETRVRHDLDAQKRNTKNPADMSDEELRTWYKNATDNFRNQKNNFLGYDESRLLEQSGAGNIDQLRSYKTRQALVDAGILPKHQLFGNFWNMRGRDINPFTKNRAFHGRMKSKTGNWRSLAEGSVLDPDFNRVRNPRTGKTGMEPTKSAFRLADDPTNLQVPQGIKGVWETFKSTMNNSIHGYATGGPVLGFAAGGQLPARGTDTVPAMLTPGEFVIRKSAVDAVGLGTLNSINSMGSGYGAKSGSGYLVHGGLHDPAKDSVNSAQGLAQVASQQLVLSEILQATKQTTNSIKKMTRAFQERKESRAQPSPTPYTLDSALFTTAVGRFDESVNRLDTIMKRGITITHKHDPMAIAMTVDGQVSAIADNNPELANAITTAVNNGINNWASSNGMTDFTPSTG